MKLFKICDNCTNGINKYRTFNGTGVTGMEDVECSHCNGSGIVEFGHIVSDVIEDKLNDIFDKVNDIFEKINE